MDLFYRELGAKKSSRIRLAVMDMWKAFRNSAARNAPQASILFDKFHVMTHLGEALDEVRKSEYGRLKGQDRAYIKGQKYTLLSHRENLTLTGRQALDKLLAANKRLHVAYLLKESFGQLWDYKTEGWARKFFENWKASLKWQRLAPYEKFARMIESHWEGIAAYCKPENKVPLGFVEGLNNKIRVLQRRAYGIRDEEYLRLKSPLDFPRTEWLADFIGRIRNAAAGDRLHSAQAILPELENINDYSKKYHHRDNPGADSAPITDGELKGYVKRVLDLVSKF